ncbi:MAG: GNAT family N-acetyltransferase [Myxococcota bacterium]
MPGLTPDQLDSFVALAFAKAPRPERVTAMRERMVRDPEWAARRRYVCDPDGAMLAVSWLAPTEEGRWILVPPRSREPLDAIGATLVDEAIALARAEGWPEVQLRVPVVDCSEALVAACVRTGAEEGPGRVEFEARLDELPTVEPRPRLRFLPARDRATAARVLARCAVNSPDALKPGELPAEAIAIMLTRAHRTHELERVIHLGRRVTDDVPVAFVCAQIDPADGWSTITMLALDPAVRGLGLGPELHRHGLAMLRAQGGRLYRGGTTSTNLPMRRCFAANGVPEVMRYREFTWTRNLRPPGGSS